MNRTFILVGVIAIVLLGTGIFFWQSGNPPTAQTGASENQAAADTRSPQELLASARDAFLGDGTAQSDQAGAALILKAAALGDEKAIGYAGTLYMGGIGVEQDITQAREWLAKSGDEEAQKLTQALMTFEAVLATMPEHEAQMEKEMSRQQAHESIRASFISALERQKQQEAQAAADEQAIAASEVAVTADAVDKLDAADEGAAIVTDEEAAPPADETTIPEGEERTGNDAAPADAEAEAPIAQ